MLSSAMASREDRLEPLSALSEGIGGGEELGAGGVTERRDLLEARDVRDGVLYGVLEAVGSDAAAALLSSSSVSHMAVICVGLATPPSWV